MRLGVLMTIFRMKVCSYIITRVFANSFALRIAEGVKHIGIWGPVGVSCVNKSFCSEMLECNAPVLPRNFFFFCF